MEELENLMEGLLADPLWRLTSGELYKIIPNAKLGLIPYEPRPEHVEIFRALIERNVTQLMLLKARRPGFSTAIGIYLLDFMIFTPGVQCSLLDQNAADASRKLDKIVYVALDNLPDWLRARIKVGAECGQGGARNGEQLSLMFDGRARSDAYFGMNARGGTNHLLWLSEWAVIQDEDEARSAKIRSGALPSARDGVVVVESTWAGGKKGDVWELLEPELNGESHSWEVQFCPWWKDPRNTSATANMSAAGIKYFEKIDPILMDQFGVVLTDGQKRWWCDEKRRQGIYQPRENPSILSECWEAPVAGSIYGESIDAAQTEGRVTPLPVIRGVPVHTFWDLGAPRQTRTIYFQECGPWANIIDIDPASDLTLVQRIGVMKGKPYNYGCHYFPHDSKQTKTSGHTLATEFAAAWLKVDQELVGQWNAAKGEKDFTNDYRKVGIRFVPRTEDEEVGINHLLEMFPMLRFDSVRCKEGLEVLAQYRRPAAKVNAADTGKPLHNFASHLADAFRTFSEAWHYKLIDLTNPVIRPSNDPWGEDDGFGPGGIKILSGPRYGPGRAGVRR